MNHIISFCHVISVTASDAHSDNVCLFSDTDQSLNMRCIDLFHNI